MKRNVLSVFIGMTFVVFGMSSCYSPTQEAAEQKKQKAESLTCAVNLEEKAKDEAKKEGKVMKAVTVYVSDFEAKPNCWENLQAKAKEFGSKEAATKVYFFDCPHHTPRKISAENTEIEKMYQDFCIAEYSTDGAGNENFKQYPFEKPKN